MRRYYAGAAVADAEAMWTLGCDAKRISVGNEPGQSYKEIAQPSRYFWSRESTPKATRAWIELSGIDNQIYTGAGKSPEATREATIDFARELRPALLPYGLGNFRPEEVETFDL